MLIFTDTKLYITIKLRIVKCDAQARSKSPSLPSLCAVEGPRKEDDMSAAQEKVDTMPKVCISPCVSKRERHK